MPDQLGIPRQQLVTVRLRLREQEFVKRIVMRKRRRQAGGGMRRRQWHERNKLRGQERQDGRGRYRALAGAAGMQGLPFQAYFPNRDRADEQHGRGGGEKSLFAVGQSSGAAGKRVDIMRIEQQPQMLSRPQARAG